MADKPFDLVLTRLPGAKVKGRTFMAQCPAHEDREASLSGKEKATGDLLLHCFAGCSVEEVLNKLGLRLSDLFADDGQRPRQEPANLVVVASYDYLDRDGNLLFQALRLSPKSFRQRRPDPERPGEWLWNLDGIETVVFRLSQLLDADPSAWVLMVEGEKDVLAAEALGLAATCNPMGAGKFKPHHAEALAGRKVAVIPDNDKPGRDHADRVARLLDGKAAEVRMVELPGLPEKGDLSDFIAAGGTAERVLALVNAAPVFDPTAESAQQETIGPRLNARKLVTVAPKGVSWLMPGFLAEGMLHGFYGDSALGKSAMALFVACCLSQGRSPLTGEAIAPISALLVLSEDSPEFTVRPRVDTFGGDLDRIHVVETVTAADGSEVVWDALKHGDLVSGYVRKHGIGLVIIDALSSAMGGADRNSEGQVRDSLTRLRQIAGETGAAIVGIGHLSKGTVGRTAYHAALGSVAFTAVPRIVWMAVPDPEDDQRRLLGVVKTNLGPKPPTYLWRWPLDGAIEVLGQSETSIEEAFSSGGGAKKATVEDAIELLTEELSGGMRLIAEVEGLAKDADISSATLRRAKERLKVRAHKIGGVWHWALPSGEPIQPSCSGASEVEQDGIRPEGQVAQPSCSEQVAQSGGIQVAQPHSQLSNMDETTANDGPDEEEVAEWI